MKRKRIVTVPAKPNKLGLELGNALEPTTTTAPPRTRPTETLISLYLSHFSTDWAEILHDDSLDGKDQVYSQISDTAVFFAALQNL